MMWETAILQKDPAAARARRQAFAMPLLMVAPDSDIALRLNLLTGIGKLAPDADVRVLPQCSHWVQHDQADRLNQLLTDFLS